MSHKKVTFMLLLIVLLSILSHSVAATSNITEKMNIIIVADLNQTAGKDLLSQVDTDRLDIKSGPFFKVTWSPDSSRMLIHTLVGICPKGKGDTQSSFVSALYETNRDGSGMTRIAWAEFTSSSGGNDITAPAWSQSGDYFTYVELLRGRMYSIRASPLFLMSDELQYIQKIELDSRMTGLENDPDNYEWSPAGDKLAVIVPGKLMVYDLEENLNLSLDITGNKFNIEDLEWSPDGQKIVFIQNGLILVIFDVESGVSQQIDSESADSIGLYRFAKWSPDSEKLVFYKMRTAGKPEPDFDVYIMDESAQEPLKIATLYSGVSGVKQWYHDSDKLLIKNYSEGKSTLYLVSIMGDKSELASGSEELDGVISPDGHIFTIRQNASSGAYDVSSLVGFDRQIIMDVTQWAWIENDLLFATNDGVSILNTSTNDIQDVLHLPKSPSIISFDTSGHFISIDNYVVEIGGQGKDVDVFAVNDSNHYEVTVLKKQVDGQPEANTNAEPSEIPGFTTCFAFMGLLFAFFIIYQKSRGER
jgi:Tol biopolymer transport system component